MILTRHGKRQQRLYGALIASLLWACVLGFYGYAWKANFDASIQAIKTELAPMVRYAETGNELQRAALALAESREQ